jgi:hypothetical protein
MISIQQSFFGQAFQAGASSEAMGKFFDCVDVQVLLSDKLTSQTRRKKID